MDCPRMYCLLISLLLETFKSKSKSFIFNFGFALNKNLSNMKENGNG